MPRIRCFFLEPTGRTRISLRRYRTYKAPHDCPLGNGYYHNASLPIDEEPEEYSEEGYITNGTKPMPPHDDPRWPTHCQCGYAFQEEDEWQRNSDTIYRRTDTGEEMTTSDAPAGAMWHAWWHDHWCTPQGEHTLVVKTPGGEWVVDSQASNCTMPEDRKQEKHHCWVRHGEPPDVTVGKDGVSCGAGAGSIQAGSYHGFLRNGWLED